MDTDRKRGLVNFSVCVCSREKSERDSASGTPSDKIDFYHRAACVEKKGDACSERIMPRTLLGRIKHDDGFTVLEWSFTVGLARSV
jgi:hypothetical protein